AADVEAVENAVILVEGVLRPELEHVLGRVGAEDRAGLRGIEVFRLRVGITAGDLPVRQDLAARLDLHALRLDLSERLEDAGADGNRAVVVAKVEVGDGRVDAAIEQLRLQAGLELPALARAEQIPAGIQLGLRLEYFGEAPVGGEPAGEVVDDSGIGS